MRWKGRQAEYCQTLIEKSVNLIIFGGRDCPLCDFSLSPAKDLPRLEPVWQVPLQYSGNRRV